ncbi:MAG TPA: cytochrome C, partial [Geobacteraceae bacterium]|nr:cytochrome C [Geobacteraceae bacterium]
MKKSGLSLFIMTFFASLALAAGPSLERGKELFNSTRLGTNGKSCAGCHQGGKRLAGAASHDEGELATIVNQCIATMLKGKPLDPGSADMKSLIMYIKSL